MHELTDVRLEGLLRRSLREEAGRAPVILTPEALEERAKVRANRRRRRSLTILAFAAVLLLPASGLLLAGALRNDPPVQPIGADTYVGIMTRIAPADLEAIAPRDVEIIAVAADGQERSIGTIPSSAVPAPRILGISGAVSSDGWLALSLGQADAIDEAIALVDLRDPTATAQVVQDPALGIGPDNFGWGTDGRFAISLNGGATLVVDPVTQAVERVSSADPAIDGLVARAEPTGGQSLWRLVDRNVNGRSYGLAIEDPPGSTRVVTWVPARSGLRDAFLHGFAPDDSLVSVIVNADVGYGPMILIPTDGRPGTYHEGFPMGFLSASMIKDMGTDRWAKPLGAAPPAAGVPAVPQTAEELAAGLGSPEPVLLATTHAADVGAEGLLRTWDAGTASLQEGIGFVAACVGPGSMTIHTGVPNASMTVDCTNGAPANEAAPGIAIDRDVRISVIAAPSTAWSVVVYDPAPSRFRATPQIQPSAPIPGASANP